MRASFFLQGRWASANPALRAPPGGAGHLIGNHSTSHSPMPELTDDGIRASVTDAGEAIAEAAGVDPRPWFRCPYGEGQDDPRVRGLLDGLGYRNVDWDVDANDWERRARAPTSCAGGCATACARTATARACCCTPGRT